MGAEVSVSDFDRGGKGVCPRRVQAICGYAGCEVLELDVQPNHVHLVVMIPPKASISDLLGRLNIALNVLRFPPIAFSGSDVTEYDVISLKIIQVWAQF